MRSNEFESWIRKRKYLKKWILLIQEFFYTLNPQLLKKIRRWLSYLLFEKKEKKKRIIMEVMKTIPSFIDIMNEDLLAALKGDPAAKDEEEIFFLYPGFYAVFIYRIAHLLYEKKVNYLPRMLSEYAHEKTGIDIHPGAQIKKGFFIDHGTGVVIGETTMIGEDVRMYQGVTLGALSLKDARKKKNKKRHPTIGNHVILYANCAVLGGETVIDDYQIIGIQEIIKK